MANKNLKKFNAKSITISKKPGGSDDRFRTAFIGLFDENNPHLIAKPPFEVLEVKDVEKVRIRDLRNISFYLVGNDLVINDLIEVHFDIADNVVTISGKQDLPK
jgi:hypothetical protein